MSRKQTLKTLFITAETLFKSVKDKLHAKTRNKYANLIIYNSTPSNININSLKKLIRELQAFNDIKDDVILTAKNLTVKKKEDAKIINEFIKRLKTQIRNKRPLEKVAFNGAFRETFIYSDEQITLTTYNINAIMQETLRKEFNDTKDKKIKYSIKTYLKIKCLMQKTTYLSNGEELTDYTYFYFNGKPQIINAINNINMIINTQTDSFLKMLNDPRGASNWVLNKIISATIATQKFKSALGKSYIELNKTIADKNACLNIKNNDNKCFDYCLKAHLMKDDIKIMKSHKQNNPNLYKKSNLKIPENINYPVSTDDIHLYEELNNIQINVFSLDIINNDIDINESIKQEYKSNKHNINVVNLLLISKDDNNHYVLIKSLSRLFTSKTNNKKKFICPHCLNSSYGSNDLLNVHISKCLKLSDIEINDLTCIECPEEKDAILQFKNFDRSEKVPFHIIADFESSLFKFDEEKETLDAKTLKYQKHVQNSYGLKLCSIIEKYDEDIKICNNDDPEDLNKNFIETLEDYAKKVYNLTTQNKDNIIFKNDKEEFEHINASQCYDCKINFTSDNLKVVNHNHITGEYKNTVCSKCLVNHKYKKFMPVYLHNLKNYDSHLFITSLAKYGYQATDKDLNIISCIPNNEQKYITFSKNIVVDTYINKKTNKITNIYFEIRFLDTIAFIASSIESLTTNLKNGCDTIEKLRLNFPNSSKHFKNDNELKLMTSKGIYPYEFIDSYEKLNLDHLPSQDKFYSKLYNSDCSDSDYNKAIIVWQTFNCKTFLDYHNIYLKSDVLLLADIWQNFRGICYTNYKLDCSHYHTLPGLSFDAMMKLTNIKLDLLTDVEKYEFCESGIRGGLSQITKRYATANNKYMSNYDDQKPDSTILYLDANNLYGWAMSEYLPYKNFEWDKTQWDDTKILNLSDTDDIGFTLECDLHIPIELHDKFNQFVPCPENIKIKKEDLNGWQQENYKESNITKLCTTFYDKKNYVIHYRYLKEVLKLGVKLLNVNRVLKYNQKPFLKTYIDKNTKLRALATSDFEKDFFKLMNNSVYGKTMENVRTHINFRLVTDENEAWKVKNLNKFTIFNENLIGVHIQKRKIMLNKPIYLANSILDDSKRLMYDFHYNFMLEKVKREDIDLLFTDTDSLCYEIRKTDIFEIIKDNKDYFDLSDYPKDDILYDKTNKKVIGKFKNESIKQITEFVGLRAKLYAFKVDKSDVKHLKCKGIKKNVAKKDLNIEMYKDCLFKRESKSISQNSIRSYKHQLYSETVTKTALSCNDDKIYICNDNINTFSLGHYKTINI